MHFLKLIVLISFLNVAVKKFKIYMAVIVLLGISALKGLIKQFKESFVHFYIKYS